MLKGIQNFLEFINYNWTTIVVIIGLCLALYKKISNYINKSDEEKINIAKQQIKEVILKMITEAEMDYTYWNESGSIKRSQVISQIYEKYPILSKAIDQESLVDWIDEEIDNSLDVLRDIIKSNKSFNDESTKEV